MLDLWSFVYPCRGRPWSRPSSVKLLSWKSWSPQQLTRRCLGFTVKSTATKERGVFTLEHNQTGSFCKLWRVHLCIDFSACFFFQKLRKYLRLCCVFFGFVSQSQRKRRTRDLCSFCSVRENSLPLSDCPRQIREVVCTWRDQVWHTLAGGNPVFLYVSASLCSIELKECGSLFFHSWLSIWRWNLMGW